MNTQRTLKLGVYRPQVTVQEFTTTWIIEAYSYRLVFAGRVYYVPELGRSLAASRAKRGRSITV